MHVHIQHSYLKKKFKSSSPNGNTKQKRSKCQYTKIASIAPEDHTNSLKAKISNLGHVCSGV